MTDIDLQRAALRFIGDQRGTWIAGNAEFPILLFDSGTWDSPDDVRVKPLDDPWWLGKLVKRVSELGFSVHFNAGDGGDRWVDVVDYDRSWSIPCESYCAAAVIAALDRAGLIPAESTTTPS